MQRTRVFFLLISCRMVNTIYGRLEVLLLTSGCSFRLEASGDKNTAGGRDTHTRAYRTLHEGYYAWHVRLQSTWCEVL